MRTLRVVVAPDSFKGTMPAAMVADALAAGVVEGGGSPDLCPLADGGEGTLDVLRGSVGGEDVAVEARAPDGRAIRASYLLAGGVAVVETAAASGLHLIDPSVVDAYAASSAGTGELLVAAARAGAREIIVGVGGSGFSDGGTGALSVIEAAGGLRGARLRVLCDVTTPYEDAARVYGPQKGADPQTVRRLTDRLHATAAELPRDPRGVLRTGAAGGLAGALWAVHGAVLLSGIDEVLDRVQFDRRVSTADLVLTGEGRLDSQTVEGKVVSGVTRRTRRTGVPVHAVVGRRDAPAGVIEDLGLATVVEAGDPGALREAAALIVHQHALEEVIP